MGYVKNPCVRSIVAERGRRTNRVTAAVSKHLEFSARVLAIPGSVAAGDGGLTWTCGERCELSGPEGLGQ